MDTENLQIQIKTFFGLEQILAEEIKKLGGRKVEIKNRAVNCEGDLGFLYKINYSARTALKILFRFTNLKLLTSISFMTVCSNLTGKNLWM
jgi:putative N6-adenine-specific DNA methylase